MATQTLPHVVPFPQSVPATEPISQIELQLLLSLRGRLKQLQEEIAAEEESLKTRLESGAEVEAGDHFAELKENSRRNVSWKVVVCRLAERLGYDPDAYTSSVLTHTKPTRSISLIVE
jgi:hypothetical protein